MTSKQHYMNFDSVVSTSRDHDVPVGKQWYTDNGSMIWEHGRGEVKKTTLPFLTLFIQLLILRMSDLKNVSLS